MSQAYNNLVQAILGAGIKPGAASRLASAISDVASSAGAKNNTRGTQFSLPKGVGFYPVTGGKDNFALHVSAPGTYTEANQGKTLFGPGGGALGVDGVSVFNGDIYCEEAGSFGDLQSRGDLEVYSHMATKTAEVGRQLECAGSLSVSTSAVECHTPLRAGSSVAVSGECSLNGAVAVNAPISLNGQVIWGGVNRAPFDGLLVYSAAGLDGTDTVLLRPSVVSVLNHFGQGRDHKLKYELDGKKYAITDIIKFDPETCSIVLQDLDPDGKAWETKDAKPPPLLLDAKIKITIS